jgi:hypothetical protein
MLRQINLFFLLMASPTVFSQTNRMLNAEETKKLKTEIGTLAFPVRAVFETKDKSGAYDLVLCENQSRKMDTGLLNSKIEGLLYVKGQSHPVQKWKITDGTIKPKGEKVETTIDFWTSYCSNTDIDGDKLVDPVMVYATKMDDIVHRVNLLIFYKEKKYSIHAVECVLDYCRTFTKSSNFSQLPKKIRDYIDELLDTIRTEKDVILENH